MGRKDREREGEKEGKRKWVRLEIFQEGERKRKERMHLAGRMVYNDKLAENKERMGRWRVVREKTRGGGEEF